MTADHLGRPPLVSEEALRRMADVVHLHVGAPKTGTTYLQDRLALNPGERERPVIYRRPQRSAA